MNQKEEIDELEGLKETAMEEAMAMLKADAESVIPEEIAVIAVEDDAQADAVVETVVEVAE